MSPEVTDDICPTPEILDQLRQEIDSALASSTDEMLGVRVGFEAGFEALCGSLEAACATGTAVLQQSVTAADHALGPLLDALDCLRRETTPAAVLYGAPRELCGAGQFDRALISHVQGSTWLPQGSFEIGDDGRVTEALASYLTELSVQLASPLLEAEVVRRRLPALVQNAATESRAHRPLVELSMTTEYVVAPISSGSSVIALLHADTGMRRRPLTTIDRDLLRMYADGVGLIYERAILTERIVQQQQTVAQVFKAAAQSMDDLAGDPTVRFNRRTASSAMPTIPALPPKPDQLAASREPNRLARLTSREREVLALLADGATNAQVADQLTVAESTVKSHVKHILHKLAAGNRAGAIACYARETRGRPRWR